MPRDAELSSEELLPRRPASMLWAMGIACKNCGVEIEALAGRRCRRCRQLVCTACVVPGQGDESSQGVVCSTCSQTQDEPRQSQTAPGSSGACAAGWRESQEPVVPVQPEPPGDEQRPLSLWIWIWFGLVLFALFAGIVYYPGMRLSRLEQELRSGPLTESRSAARELRKMGGDRAINILIASAQSGPAHARVAAIGALGYVADGRVRNVLRDLSHDSDTEERFRYAAKQALRRHARMDDHQNASGASP